MSKTATLTINGRQFSLAPDQTILAAAKEAGIAIPHLCHLPGRRDADQPCLLCLVEVNGKRARACKTLIADGMVIETETPALVEHRKERLTRLAAGHYGDCKAPCSMTCPGSINVQGYIGLIARRQFGPALQLIREKNPLPGIVCRVCPAFCEYPCRRALLDELIVVNNLKRFAFDSAARHPLPPETAGPATGHKAAIIGGGPAGLSAAWFLRRQGHSVTIFEAGPALGGAARTAIPAFKLPKENLAREIEAVLSLGVEVRTNTAWGRDFSLTDLQQQGFEAVFIAVGLAGHKKLVVPGSEMTQDGLNFLAQVNQGSLTSLSGKVLVVGGSKTAVEAARCAVRMGAEEVLLIHDRAAVRMTAYEKDIRAAQEEKVRMQMLTALLAVRQEEDGTLTAELARTEVVNDDVRSAPVVREGASLIWQGGTILNCRGRQGDNAFLSFGELESRLEVTAKKTIKVSSSTMQTSLPGIYAGGEVASGPRSVIQAVNAGRKAAEAINRQFGGTEVALADGHFNFSKGHKLDAVDMSNYSGMAMQPRTVMPERASRERSRDFSPTELGWSEDMAVREAERCLECGCSALSKCELRPLCRDHKISATSVSAPDRRRSAVDTSHPFMSIDAYRCIGCQRCERSCEFDAFVYAPGEPVPTLTIKDNCVSCGACVDACPTGALTKKQLAVPLLPGEAKLVRSVCTYCGTGCSVDIAVKSGAIVEIKALSDAPPNNGDLCVKGRFGYDFYRHSERLNKPLIRERLDQPFREVSWQEALSFAAAGFQHIQEQHGPQSLGVLSSSRCENEVNYLAQKFCRAVFRSNSVDNCARVCHAPSVSGLRIALGSSAATNALEDIEGTEVLLISGSNPAEAHPVVGMKVRRALSKGGRLIVLLLNKEGHDPLRPRHDRAP